MRKILIALLGCVLLAAVLVPMAIGAEAGPTPNQVEQPVAPAAQLEPSEGLLAIQSLGATPMTDAELDQVVGAAAIVVAVGLEDFNVFGIGFAFAGLFTLDLDQGSFIFDTVTTVGGTIPFGQ
jgi:hypothetical protein